MGKRREKHLGLTISKPILGTSALRQVHHLKADDLVIEPPILGEPSCGEGPPMPPTADLVTDSPILGTPTFRQVHHMAAGADSAASRQTAKGREKAREKKTAKAHALAKVVEECARDYRRRHPGATNNETASNIETAVLAALPGDHKYKNLVNAIRKKVPKN
jgi:hypothetical protein